MKEQIVSRKMVHDRIHEWMKTHTIHEIYTSFVLLPFDPATGKIIKIIDRAHWLQIIDDPTIEWVEESDFADPNDCSLEGDLLDKAKSTLSGRSRPRNKKNKGRNFIIEYQWQNKKEFNTRQRTSWLFGTTEVFGNDWRAREFNNKYTTRSGAIDSYKSMKQTAGNAYIWTDHCSGRNWRVHNIVTNEIFILD